MTGTREGAYDRRLPYGMNYKGAGIFFLKEAGSTGLELPRRNKGEYLLHPQDLREIRGKKKKSPFWRLQGMQYPQGKEVFVRAGKWRKHLKKNLRFPGIKLMKYQEFQSVHWKDLREKEGVKDCSRLGDIKIDMGMRGQVMKEDSWFLQWLK